MKSKFSRKTASGLYTSLAIEQDERGWGGVCYLFERRKMAKTYQNYFNRLFDIDCDSYKWNVFDSESRVYALLFAAEIVRGTNRKRKKQIITDVPCYE